MLRRSVGKVLDYSIIPDILGSDLELVASFLATSYRDGLADRILRGEKNTGKKNN